MSIKLYDIIEDLSPRDKILTYLKSTRKDKLVLTDGEQRYMAMMDYADDIMRAHMHRPDKELINMIVAKYDISPSFARNVLQDSKYVHGTTQKPVKSYERKRLTEFLYSLIDEAMNPKPILDSEGEVLRKPEPRNLPAAINAAKLIVEINKLSDDEQEGNENDGNGTVIIRPAFKPEILGVELPENVDDLISKLRKRTLMHREAENMIKQDGD